MCYGKITKVWIQNEPIKAIKCVEIHPWSPKLSKLYTAGGWHLAMPKIITPGGGGGVVGTFYSAVKSISEFLIDSKYDLLEDVHLSGFHAWKDLDSFYLRSNEAELSCYALLYEVELRGLLQKSELDELVASEMKVVRRLDPKEFKNA